MNKAEHKKYEHHSIAGMFPIEEGASLSLGENILQVGLLKPIVLFEGKILDGRLRQEACIAVKVEPKFTDFSGSTLQAVDYVFAVNFPFSLLTASQKACVAAEYMEIKLKNTLKIGNKTKGYKPTGRTMEKVAAQFNISRQSLHKAQSIMRNDLGKFKEIKAGTGTIHEVFTTLNPHIKQYKPVCLPIEKARMIEALGLVEDMSQDGWNFSYSRKGNSHYGVFWLEKCGDMNLGHTTFYSCVQFAMKQAHDKAEMVA